MFCLFQHKLHQSTDRLNYLGNGSTLDRSICSDPDESSAIVTLIMYSSKEHKDESVSPNEKSNSTVRKYWKYGQRELKEET